MSLHMLQDSEAFKRSELKLNQTVEELVYNGSTEVAASVKNAISFSSISGDATAIDQQFNRLKTFVAEASEPYKAELTFLMFPMFVHLYLELISNSQRTAAQKFHSRHVGLFMQSEEYKSIVEPLSDVLTVQDIKSHSEICIFRENKYIVKLSEDCFEYLLRFLKNTDHLTLLQLINFYIDLDVQGAENQMKLMSTEDGITSSSSAQSIQRKTDSEKVENDNNKEQVNALKEAIRRVREGPPSLPSICLYTVINAFQGLSSAALSEDNTLLAGGFEDSHIRLWNLIPSPLISECSQSDISKIILACDQPHVNDTKDIKSDVKVLRGHGGSVYGMKFMPDNEIFFSCSEDTTVRAWSLRTHTNVALYKGHAYPIFDIDVSSLGLYFATASQDRTARIWTPDRTFPLRILAGHNMDVDCIKFHPNCNYVATGSTDKSVRLWSVQDGNMVRMFQGHRGSIFALAFSPNGQLLASAGEDRRIKIWDLASGSPVKELRGHTDTVYSMCFNGDGTVLASSGLEHGLRLWDVRKNCNLSTTTGSVVEGHMSPELLAMFPTKSTSVPYIKYTRHNLLLAVGMSSLPPHATNGNKESL